MENQEVKQVPKPRCRIIGFDGGLTVIIPPSIKLLRNPFGIALIDPYKHVVAWLAVTDQDDYGNPLPRWKFNSGLDCFQFLLMDNVEEMSFDHELIESM